MERSGLSGFISALLMLFGIQWIAKAAIWQEAGASNGWSVFFLALAGCLFFLIGVDMRIDNRK
jgi:hypothetical protein